MKREAEAKEKEHISSQPKSCTDRAADKGLARIRARDHVKDAGAQMVYTEESRGEGHRGKTRDSDSRRTSLNDRI